MRTCGQCGAALQEAGLDQVCPKCFLGQGLASAPPQNRPPQQGPSPHAVLTPRGPEPPPADPLDHTVPNPPSHAPPGLARQARDPEPGREQGAGGTRGTSAAENAPPRCFGDYALLEEIARGGMGVVYKARQVSLNRVVAVKMILARQLDQPDAVKRFRTEAEAAAQLQHPHIVAIHEVGEVEGQHFFSMDFVAGQSLAQWVRQYPLSPRKAAEYVAKIAGAIHYAHQRGVVHRDLKPSNVLIDEHDQPRVTDFGLAKLAHDDGGLTVSGQVLGTPSYMAPEQAQGRGREVTVRTDVYALGAMLYELVTGRPPFKAESSLATLKQVVEAEPVSPRALNPKVPRDLETICLKCLSKEPGRRYGSGQEVAEELGRYLRQEPIRARPVSGAEKVWRWGRRNPRLAGALGVAALILLLGVAGITWQWQRAREERESAEANGYVSDMYAAQQALLADDLRKARQLLEYYGPGSGRERRRGFEWRYLAAAARPDIEAMDASSQSPVYSLALSPDGHILAVGRLGGTIELWNPATLQRTATLEGLGANSRHDRSGVVAFSPNGQWLAVSGTNPVIRLWDLASRRIVREYDPTNLPVRLSFSPDGRHLAASCWGGDVLVWGLANGQLERQFPKLSADEGFVVPMSFSPDGRYLAVGGHSGLIRIREWLGDRFMDIPAHDGAVSSLAYASDGGLLASAGGYGPQTIRLWNPSTGESAGTLSGHRSGVWDLRFAPGSRRLFSAGGDQTIRAWDATTRQLVRTWRGCSGEVMSLGLSPDHGAIFSGSKDGALARSTARTNRASALQIELPRSREAPAFLREGGSVATLRHDGAMVLCDVAGGGTAAVLEALGTNYVVLGVAPQHGWLACATLDGALRIWSLTGNRTLTNLVIPPVTPPCTAVLRFTPGEDRLVTLGCDVSGTTWDTGTWTRQSTFEIRGHLCGAAIAPDNRTLVLGHEAGQLTWWDLRRGVKLDEFQAHRMLANGLAFSPDGRLLASASQDDTVRLWDATSRRGFASWKAHLSGVTAVAFSPDGARLATANASGSAVRLWDVPSRRELLTLSDLRGELFFTLQFSADGSRLLCSGWAGPSYVWSVPALAELDAAYGAPSQQ